MGEIDDRFTNNNDTYSPRQNYSHKRPVVSKKSESVVGKMVSHSEMGTGVVIVDNGNILTVAFKTRGIKNVARDYLKFI